MSTEFYWFLIICIWWNKRMMRWRRHVSRITKETLEQLIAMQFYKIVDNCFEITPCWQPIIGLISLSMQGSQTVWEAFAIRSIFIDDCKETATIFGSAVFHGNIIFSSSQESTYLSWNILSTSSPQNAFDYLVSRFGKVLNNYLHTSGDSQEHNIFQATVTLTYSLPLRQINHSFLAIGFFQLLSKPYHEAEAHVTDRGKLMQNGEHDHTFWEVFQRFL